MSYIGNRGVGIGAETLTAVSRKNHRQEKKEFSDYEGEQLGPDWTCDQVTLRMMEVRIQRTEETISMTSVSSKAEVSPHGQ